MGEVEDKGHADQYRRNGGQGVIDGELGSQGLRHLPSVHAQLLQQGELTPVPLRLTELLNGQDRGGLHPAGLHQLEAECTAEIMCTFSG